MGQISLEKKHFVFRLPCVLGRLWAVFALSVVFLGLWWSQNQWSPRAIYGAVVVQTAATPSSTRLHIYTPGSPNRRQCETQLNGVLSSLGTLCPTCQVQHHSCSAQPSDHAVQVLSGAPLRNPSVRMPNGGVVEYQAEQADFALQACRETEAQSKHALQCTPPRVERVFSLDDRNPWMGLRHMQQAYLGLAGLLALLMLAVVLRGHARQKNASVSEPFRAVCLVWQQKIFLVCVDALLLVLAYWMMGFPNDDNVSAVLRYDVRQAFLHLALIVVNVLCYWVYFEQYVRRRPWWDELREIFRVVTLSLLLASAALFYANLDAGRGLTLWTWGGAFVLLPLGRIAARQVLGCFGLWRRPAYIVGTGRNAQEAYLAVQAESYMGYSIIGFIDPAGAVDGASSWMEIKGHRLPVLSISEEVSLASDFQNVELIVAMENLSEPHAQKLLQQLMLVNDSVHIIPSIRGLPLFGAKLSHFFSHEVLFLTVRNNLSRRGYLIVKRTFDVVASLLLIIGLLPLMLWIAYRIWKEDGGPVIFSQPRVGYGTGSAFRFLKFRSMVRNADDVLLEWKQTNSPEWQRYVAQNFKLPDDPRILQVGRFIRGNSLDELPQLFNVLKGDMSLVGPRPLLERELDVYGDNICLYQQARPGITGLWQVSGRSQTTFAERVALDQWYVQNWSLWYDIAILFKTFKVVFGRKGAY